MSSNYNKYRSMSPEQLQRAIDESKVTPDYLVWLGIIGPGKSLRNTITKGNPDHA